MTRSRCAFLLALVTVLKISDGLVMVLQKMALSFSNFVAAFVLISGQAIAWDPFHEQPPIFYNPVPKFSTPLRHPQRPRSRIERSEPGIVKQALPGPLIAIVSIASQRLTIYDSGGAIIHSRVSTGQPGHSTPTGVFSVIGKERYHESNIYSGAPMPYMQRITWSGIAMHEGYLPGYPASHGCIRMPSDVAIKLFGMTKLGMRVVVSPTDVEAVAFSHPALPVPTMLPADIAASGPNGNLPEIQVVANGPMEHVTPGKLNPHQHALGERDRLRKVAIDTSNSAKALLDASHQASAEANRAVEELRASQTTVAGSERGVAKARLVENAADNPDAQAEAQQAMADAEKTLADAQQHLSEAKTTEALSYREAFAAADAWRTANAMSARTAIAAKQAEKSVEPLSVLISRKDNRLYARQGFTPIFDAPVSFKTSQPLGTHAFTVMTADEASGQLGWTVVTVPKRSDAPLYRSGSTVPSADAAATTASAAEAFESVELAPELRQRLDDRIWLGGSIIVSDFGLGDETGEGTDFVVLTK